MTHPRGWTSACIWCAARGFALLGEPQRHIAVLDYLVPLVVDGAPPQIVRIRPLFDAIVPRAIEVEVHVVDAHSLLAQVESEPARNTRNNTGRSRATGQSRPPGGGKAQSGG